MICGMPECDNGGRLRRGLCSMHYYRMTVAGTLPPLKSAADRFWEKVSQVGDCWVWQGAKKTDAGYGYFTPAGNGSMVRAHRWSYEQLIGPIPEGLQLDHLCRNPSCVNPYHLDPVTAKVNTGRSLSPAGLNARKTHCPNGHAYDSENTRIDNHGRRHCRTCRNAKCREYYYRRRAVA